MKNTRIYSIPNTRLADSDDFESLRKFADEMGHENDQIIEVEAPLLEDGDKIIVECHRGGSEDEDGIGYGGEWADEMFVWKCEDEKIGIRTVGTIHDVDTNEFMGCLGADMRYNGFPYRNIRLCG